MITKDLFTECVGEEGSYRGGKYWVYGDYEKSINKNENIRIVISEHNKGRFQCLIGLKSIGMNPCISVWSAKSFEDSLEAALAAAKRLDPGFDL